MRPPTHEAPTEKPPDTMEPREAGIKAQNGGRDSAPKFCFCPRSPNIYPPLDGRRKTLALFEEPQTRAVFISQATSNLRLDGFFYPDDALPRYPSFREKRNELFDALFWVFAELRGN